MSERYASYVIVRQNFNTIAFVLLVGPAVFWLRFKAKIKVVFASNRALKNMLWFVSSD